MPKDLHELPKLRDSISYLYIEHAVIEQDDSSIIVIRGDGKIPVPVAMSTCLLLGPGTSITHAAVKAAAENGCLIVVNKARPGLRGELTRWLLEVKPGVFVGKVSAAVRGKLWEKVQRDADAEGALLLFSSDSEQGFRMELSGDPKRTVVDFDGIQLIRIQ